MDLSSSALAALIASAAALLIALGKGLANLMETKPYAFDMIAGLILLAIQALILGHFFWTAGIIAARGSVYYALTNAKVDDALRTTIVSSLDALTVPWPFVLVTVAIYLFVSVLQWIRRSSH